MIEHITAIIGAEFDRYMIDIKDRYERVEVKVQKEALAEPFLELWDRIKYKTTYSLEFDTEQFIVQAAVMLEEELEVRISKLEYMKAKLENKASAIEVNETTETFETSKERYKEAPDIISFLQNETTLTITTLIKILKKSGTLNDFKRNPQMYIMEVARIIKVAKRHMMVDGIKYERLAGDDVIYDQRLFLEEEITSYEEKVIETLDNRTPYDHIVYDSNVEKEFAIQCEKDKDVKFYNKLPYWFKVKTPLGPYNPDWALLKEENGKEKLYFVVETKGDVSSNQLRLSEGPKFVAVKNISKH